MSAETPGNLANLALQKSPTSRGIARRGVIVPAASWFFDGLRSGPCKDLIGGNDQPDPGPRTDGDLCRATRRGDKALKHLGPRVEATGAR
jgi:hypothetical protein